MIRNYCPKGLPAVAYFAINPPKWQAGSSREAAELTFWYGGMFGYCHRNDTVSADCTAAATAMQFVHVAAIFAMF